MSTPGVRRREAPSDPVRRSWDLFHRQARRARKAWRGCEVCPENGRDPNAWTEVHHVVSQKRLKKYGRENKLPKMRLQELLTDPRNSIVLCREHHHLHTVLMRRLPLGEIPKPAWEFAAELGLLEEMKEEYRER